MPEAKVKKNKHIFLLIRIGVVVCGVIWGVLWVSKGERWHNLTKIFLEMNLWVFAAVLGIFVMAQLIVGLRWWLLLRSQSVYIGFWAAERLFFLGWFYNNFMPGSVGGDLIRAWYVTKHTDKRFEAALSVFVDRGIGLLTTLIIAAFFYTVFLRGQGPVIFSGQQSRVGFVHSVGEHKWILFWVVVVVAAVFGGLLLHRRGRLLLGRGWEYIRKRGISVLSKFGNAIVVYCRNPLAILTVFGLTVFLQIVTITGFWFLGVDLGIEASVKYYYVFFTLTWVLGAVPVSIAGAGVVEGSLVYLFIQFAGVEAEAALALALCQRIVWMLSSLPGAVIHLAGAHLPKEFFIDYEKSIT